MTNAGLLELNAAGGRQSTPDHIADTLRQAICEGRIAGGAQLKQTEVASTFGVSVVPVREAFSRLVADGLATLIPNRGVMVTPVSAENFIDIAEMRSLLEPHVLRLSGPKLTDQDFAAAETALHAAEAATDLLERARHHWDFHRILYSRAGRPRQLAQIASLYTNINRYLLPLWSRVGLSEDWVGSHMAIVRKIRAGDINGAADLIASQSVESAERVHDVLRRIEEK